MSTAIQRRRGTTAQHAAFTGLTGETTVDTDKNVVVVHNGATAGGFPLLRENGSQNLVTTGTVTGASLSPTSSTVPTNGIYLPAANSVAISTGGSGRLFVDSSGRVGVDTSTFSDARESLIVAPASGQTATFSIIKTGSTSANASLFFGDTDSNYSGGITYEHANDAFAFRTNGSERLRITSAGLVGVGDSAPSTNFVLRGTGSSIAGVNAHFLISDSTTAASGVGGSVLFEGNYTSGGARAVFGAIAGIKENGTDSNYAGSLRFYTRANGSLPALAMTIDSSQRVGISTTSPGAALDVSGNIRLSAASPNIEFNNGGPMVYLPSGNTLAFATGGGPASPEEKARIDSSGRLLVGTSSSFGGGYGTANLQVSAPLNGDPPEISLKRNYAGLNGSGVGAIAFYSPEGRIAQVSANTDGTQTAGTSSPGALLFQTTADGATSPTERLRITSNGAMLYGTSAKNITSPNNPGFEIHATNTLGLGLYVSNANNNQTSVIFQNTTGRVGFIDINAASVTYSTTSDYRLKENVAPVADGIARLLQLKPSRFNFITDPDNTIDGFIAHEVQDVVPEAISGEKDAIGDDGKPIHQGIDQSKLVPLLTAALQEAVAKIESLEARLTAAGI